MRTGVFLIFAICWVGLAFAAVPNQMTYQGKLTGPDGQPVSDGTYSLVFNIYTDSTGGAAVWTETNSVNTEKGIFSVRLGYVNVLSPSLFSGPNLFLGISINGGAEISARHRLTSVAYAFQAANADTAQYALVAPAGADSDWTVSGGNLYRLNGKVGIGTNNPICKVEVVDSIGMNNLLKLKGTTNAEVRFLLEDDAGGYGLMSKSDWGWAGFAISNMDQNSRVNICSRNGDINLRVSGDEGPNWENDSQIKLHIDGSTGNVGIGTAYPSSKLEVVGTTTLKSPGSTIASILAIDTKNTPGLDVNTGQIFGICNEGASDARMGFKIINSNGSGWAEALTIKNGGNVGIRTPNPLSNLDVNGNGSFYQYAGDGYAPALSVKQHSNMAYPNQTALLVTAGVTDSSPRRFSIYTAGEPWTLRLHHEGDAYIDGNVGIGTTSPIGKLNVVGDLRVDGALCVTGQKLAIVPTSKGMTKVYSEESAEVWFTDYGRAKLTGGKCHIDLDPLFLETVTINDNNQMMVFLQEEDECNGLIVKPGLTGFDVLEKGGGKSDAQFSYRIVAKRKGQENERLASVGGGK